jgi:exonuclease SbcD
VAVAHAFVVGGRESESERPLSVGGAGTVSASCFTGFDYVALGHLHLPQDVPGKRDGGCTAHYAGSLLKYSFAEAEHAKSVSLVELPERGGCRIERIPLSPRRDVRRLVGHLAEILQGPAAGESRDDYLMVTLRDRGAILDALGKLRAVYPNVLHIERETAEPPGEGGARAAQREVGDADLFAAFFHEVTGEELSAEEHRCFVETADALRTREREAGS